jgi:hypothetical protein
MAVVILSLGVNLPALGASLTNISITGTEGHDYTIKGSSPLETILQTDCNSGATCEAIGFLELQANAELQSQINYHQAQIIATQSPQSLAILPSLYDGLLGSSERVQLPGMVAGQSLTLGTLTFAEIYGENTIAEARTLLSTLELPVSHGGASIASPIPVSQHLATSVGFDSTTALEAALEFYNFEAAVAASSVDSQDLKTELQAHFDLLLDFSTWPSASTAIASVNQSDDHIQLKLTTDSRYNVGNSISRVIQSFALEHGSPIDFGILNPDVDLYLFRPGTTITHNGETTVIAPEFGVFTDPVREISFQAATVESVPEPRYSLWTLAIILGIIGLHRQLWHLILARL